MQDRFGHAVVVGRDDEDLVRLLAAGHEQVDRRADDHRDDVAVDHVREAVAYQQRRADDEDVGVDDDFAVGDAPVFVEDFGDDVRAARGAAGGEADGHAGACEQCAEDDREQLVVEPQHVARRRVVDHEIGFHERHESRCHDDAEESLETEVPPHRQPRQEQQEGIDRQEDRTDADVDAPHFGGLYQ